MGILKGLLAAIVIMAVIGLIVLLVALFKNYKNEFEKRQGRSFYHLWAIFSWIGIPHSLASLSWVISEPSSGDQLWIGWIPVFTLLAAYLYHMAKYGKGTGFVVITLQIIPACVFLWFIMMIFYIFQSLFDNE